MRSLILYYSQTGNTKKVAELLAPLLDAEIGRVTCPEFEGGFVGGLKQAWSIFTRSSPKISLPPEAKGTYDLVVMAAPVWAARPATPLRSLIATLERPGPRRAIFLTCDGSSDRFPGEAALTEAKSLCKQPPVAATIFKAADINGRDFEDRVEAFADQLQRGMHEYVALSSDLHHTPPSSHSQPSVPRGLAAD
jgi:flavodoxin